MKPDTSIYNSDSWYPSPYIKIANKGITDGAKLVANPEDFSTCYIPPNEVVQESMIKGGGFKSGIRIYPGGIPPDTVDSSYNLKGNRLFQYEGEPEYNVYPCVIISPDDPSCRISYEAFYAIPLRWKGIPTRVIPISTILSNCPGNNDAEKVRNFIREMWDYLGNPWGRTESL